MQEEIRTTNHDLFYLVINMDSVQLFESSWSGVECTLHEEYLLALVASKPLISDVMQTMNQSQYK